MLYPHAATSELDDALFRDPPAVYRGAPFWSWNGRLDPDLLCRQIDDFKAMGLGGGHMHPRTGLATPYLGQEYMDCVRRVVAHCRETGMLAWLYDEDRWPSGFGGGLVTGDERYRLRCLRLTPRPYDDDDQVDPRLGRALSRRDSRTVLLARLAVSLDADGCLLTSRRLGADQQPIGDETVWYAYREISPCSSWYNHQSYVDTLNPAAIDRFIEVTHAAYHQAVGEDFGGVVPAIFTDEPQVHPSGRLGHAGARDDVLLPWTDDLPETYHQAFACDLLDDLPALLWEQPDGALAPARWRFREHVTERFTQAFSDRVGAWCQAHDIAATGHLMGEHSLASQTDRVGECMRHYRSFTIPGIDMLCDAMELTTVKQAASVARQDGREGVLSELYGVTNWNFPFAGHKRQGDWQAALGVTVRVHHLTWMTMQGNAKRDYPASIGAHMPWMREYPLVEDHFARLNTVLTRGKALVRVAMIHPVESHWLLRGPIAQTAAACDELEEAFQGLTRTLLYNGIDCDFIAESLLPDQCRQAHGPALQVGRMAYDAVVVPHLRSIRSTTLERLEALVDGGGTVVFAGRVPDHVDALPSDRAARLAARCRVTGWGAAALLPALEPLRELRLSCGDGRPADDVLHQLRQDGPRRHLFLCCTRTTPHMAGDRHLQVALRGTWQVVELVTADGSRRPVPVRHVTGWTEFTWQATAAGSLLVSLEPCPVSNAISLPPNPVWRAATEIADPVTITLDEPNVLLLDQAAFRCDDGPWQEREEIHRAENRMRAALGWSPKTGQVAQPWCEPAVPVEHHVTLRFTVDCAVSVRGARLALEDAVRARICLDGRPLRRRPQGSWVDPCLATVPLPILSRGQHVLEVTLPFTPTGSLEWMYLLGDFGVALRGRHARITAPVRTLAWGDWTRQGLPFYAGNVTYRCHIAHPGGPLAVRVPHFAAPLIAVDLDGRRCGCIAYDPFRLELGEVSAGDHELALTAFGSRINAFGAVHCANPDWRWWGPHSWETTGDEWTYEYRLWTNGITAAPRWQRPT